MRKPKNVIYFSLLIVSISSFGQTTFEETLGTKKSNSLEMLIGLFDNEVAKHLKPNNDTTGIIRSFILLAEMQAPMYSSDFMSIDSLKTIEVMKSIKQSKLQDDIWLGVNEKYSDKETIRYYKRTQDSLSNYDEFNVAIDLYETLDLDYDSLFDENDRIIEYDTTRRISRYSSLVKALYTCCSDNIFIKDYCETKIMAEYPSSIIIANEFLENADKIDLNNFYIKSIIVMEFYYHFLYNYVYKKHAPKTE